MRINRRGFLKLGGVAGAATLVARPARACPRTEASAEMPAVLVDATRCAGCRGCEAACAEANRLGEPVSAGDERVFERVRESDTETFTVVNRYADPAGGEPRYVKRQCMHCLEPGCASACLARALEKTPEGPVVYHADRCLGCRYCMVACPFGVPKFEYASRAPRIRKCTFCAERQAEGLPPACASVCPTGALTFGRRQALLEEARLRIYQNPERYEHHVFGEEEVGGTSWMYIADRPFASLGFDQDLPEASVSSLAQPALAAVPLILTVWPPLLMGLYSFSRRRAAVAAEGERSEEGEAAARGAAEEDDHA